MPIVVCIVCKKEFTVRPYRLSTAKTCSRSCAGKVPKPKLFRRTERQCKECGATFSIQTGQLKNKGYGTFCSQKCNGKWKERAYQDNPKKNPHAMNRTRERNWSRAVRQRDNNTCQRCRIVGPHLDAHHVATRALRPDLKFEISNGVTLCRVCHKWVHDHPVEAIQAGLLSTESYELAAKKRRAA